MSELDSQLVRDLNTEKERLRKALEKYADCRHGEAYCNCTVEARAALYPYLRRDKLLRGTDGEKNK